MLNIVRVWAGMLTAWFIFYNPLTVHYFPNILTIGGSPPVADNTVFTTLYHVSTVTASSLTYTATSYANGSCHTSAEEFNRTLLPSSTPLVFSSTDPTLLPTPTPLLSSSTDLALYNFTTSTPDEDIFADFGVLRFITQNFKAFLNSVTFTLQIYRSFISWKTRRILIFITWKWRNLVAAASWQLENLSMSLWVFKHRALLFFLRHRLDSHVLKISGFKETALLFLQQQELLDLVPSFHWTTAVYLLTSLLLLPLLVGACVWVKKANKNRSYWREREKLNVLGEEGFTAWQTSTVALNNWTSSVASLGDVEAGRQLREATGDFFFGMPGNLDRSLERLNIDINLRPVNSWPVICHAIGALTSRLYSRWFSTSAKASLMGSWNLITSSWDTFLEISYGVYSAFLKHVVPFYLKWDECAFLFGIYFVAWSIARGVDMVGKCVSRAKSGFVRLEPLERRIDRAIAELLGLPFNSAARSEEASAQPNTPTQFIAEPNHFSPGSDIGTVEITVEDYEDLKKFQDPRYQ